MIRINGDLVEIQNAPILDATMTHDLIYAVMNNEQRKAFESTLELDFNVILSAGNQASFRANAFHQVDGASAVFRVIPFEIPTLEQLGTPPIVKKLLLSYRMD